MMFENPADLYLNIVNCWKFAVGDGLAIDWRLKTTSETSSNGLKMDEVKASANIVIA